MGDTGDKVWDRSKQEGIKKHPKTEADEFLELSREKYRGKYLKCPIY